MRKLVAVGFISIMGMMTICTLLILNALGNIEDAIRESNNRPTIINETHTHNDYSEVNNYFIRDNN